MTVLLTLTTAGADSGPFNLYSDVDGFTSAFEVGVAKASLEAGYASSLVPDYTTVVRVLSTGACTNYIDILLDSPTPYVCDTLGSASSFSILAATTVTNSGGTTIIGDLGLYPGTSVTGFPPGTISGVSHITDAAASIAKTDANDAFICLNSLSSTGSVGADIGGTTITPGVYSVTSSLAITGTVILDGGGDPDSVFIFKIPTTFIPAANASVSLINSAQAGNVYWIVGSSATLSVNSTTYGNVIALTSIAIETAAKLSGRAIALTGAITIASSYIENKTCTINPCTPI